MATKARVDANGRASKRRWSRIGLIAVIIAGTLVYIASRHDVIAAPVIGALFEPRYGDEVRRSVSARLERMRERQAERRSRQPSRRQPQWLEGNRPGTRIIPRVPNLAVPEELHAQGLGRPDSQEGEAAENH
jgi:hypothetical protein